ncbi:DeoR/GlpR family DNA-binding transcription regulator [Peribacillus huizhouensis]|uniref:DeoR/GlpR family transcriptional regulator of sugar metabolism n=1 Tax=Peribacillus huizhouensis TaxID=1501239 RepID=A0ABR6CUU6_9BACI|nr:DeoR/GlpR family DNA-binding transcription regulator [Peribacillus huizhouensis]MBA9028807.1 DeoR/GlpR family transcriptional regulator of sugar metabolism [Peribacillus huizhouensis]
MDKYLITERYRVITRELELKNKINVVDLAIKLNVTPETIRKDLSALEEKKKLRRIHGGAIHYFGLIKEPHFNKKIGISHHQKKMIGESAATFIMDGETVALDVGSTTLHIASSIKNVKNITIVTNSLAAAEILNNRLENQLFDGKVIVLGGTTNPLQRSISGPLTNHLLEHFYFDKAFISCGGISKDGICDFDIDEATASTIMMKRSRSVYVVTDSSKINQKALFHIGSFSSIDCVITDQEMPADWSKDAMVRNLKWIKVGNMYEN